jgi:hypothetical protein
MWIETKDGILINSDQVQYFAVVTLPEHDPTNTPESRVLQARFEGSRSVTLKEYLSPIHAENGRRQLMLALAAGLKGYSFAGRKPQGCGGEVPPPTNGGDQ